MYRTFLALRYLRSRLVNLISVGGVMAGVGVLISVTAIMDGFQERVRTIARGSLSDITMMPTQGPGVTEEAPRTFTELDKVLRAADRRIKATSAHLRVPIAFFPSQDAHKTQWRLPGRNVHLMQCSGIDWAYEREASDIEQKLVVAYDRERPFHHPKAEEREKPTVMLSRRFLETFRLNPEMSRPPTRKLDFDRLSAAEYDKRLREELMPLIGREISLKFVIESGEGEFKPITRAMLISAIYDGGDSNEDISQVYMARSVLQKEAQIDLSYTHVRVKLFDPDDGDAVKRALSSRFGRSFGVMTWEDQRRDILRAVANEKVLLIIVLSFIVLLGGFVILATLTLTVVEKTRDVGIIVSLGAPRSGILSIFMWTGLLIGLIGSTFGIGLGYLFTHNVNGVKQWLYDAFGIDIFPVDIYRFRDIPAIWSWPTAFLIAACATALAFVCGLLPALRAASMDPVKALRHE